MLPLNEVASLGPGRRAQEVPRSRHWGIVEEYMGAFIGYGEIGVWVSNRERDAFLDWFAAHRCAPHDARWDYCRSEAQRWSGCCLELGDLIPRGEVFVVSDTEYAGFGSAETMARAFEIAEAGGWSGEGEAVRPEDGVNPELSTSTRSICRRRGVDTGTRMDWYVVPTRGATFGGENGEEEYAP